MANKVNKTVIGKSPALGVKMAAPAAIMVATAKAMSAKSNEEENFKMLVATLQSELEAERKTVRQLRRERDAEVVKVRNEEQTKSSTALKDLTKKLQEEKLKEVELQREALKSKLEFDQGKVVKLKDREIAKLRGDLARCQDELKEELSKRGLSTSARATFDTERQKLLQEVRDLQIAKRQLEDRLSSAGENEKRLQLEIIRLQENCKQEVARVEREANVEVKKLLDELKSKDHMLELMDRSIYPDRATMLKTRLDKLSIEEMLNLTHEQVNVWSYCSNTNGRSNRSRSNSAASNRSSSNNSNGSNRTCQINADVKSEDVRNLENQESAGGSHSAPSNRRRCVEHSKCGTTNINKSKRSYSACGRSHTSFSAAKKGRSKSAGAAIRSSQTVNSIDKDNSCSLNTSCSFISNNSEDGRLKNEHIDNSASKTTETNISAPSGHDNCVIKGGCALQAVNLQKKLYEAEKKLKLAEGLQRAVIEKNKNLSVNGNQLESKIKSLNEQIRNMKNERALNKREIKRLNEVIANINGNSGAEGDSNSELQNCRQRCAELEQVLVSLRHDCLEKDRRIGLLIKSHQKHRHKYEPKTVRFMLPDESDGKESEELTESTNSLSSSSCSDPIESDELLIQSVHKDYETLMQEHLKLEKYCTSLIQSKTGNDKSINQELSAKRESLDLVIEAMEEKLKMADEREKKLRHQLQEIYDQNEELEFRILELEEFSERKVSSCQQDEAEDSHAQLIAEIERLRRRLCQYEALSVTDLEKEASSQCAPTTLEGDPLRLSVENLRKLRASLSDSDEENQMVQSFSTMTSGFDEISCISLELDDRTEMPDMPAEEEADLEQDADDIGAEMPSEVYDEIPEMVQNFGINYSNATDVANPTNGTDSFEKGSDQKMHNVIDNSNLSTAVNIMAKNAGDNIIHNTSACLVAEPSCIINSSIVANEIIQTPKPDVENQAYIRQTISPLEHNKAHTPWFNANSQRIVDLEDQLDILASVDCKYSETIKMLNDIEEQLSAVIPSTEVTCETAAKSSEESLEVDKTIDQFWPSASEEINDQIAVAKEEMKTFPFEDSTNLELNDSQSESRSAMQHCTEVLQITQTILEEDSIKCKELDTRIQALELQQNCESSYDIFENVTRNEQNSFADCQFTQQQPLLCLAEPSDSSLLGSLKRLALDVVAAGFRADLLELKSLTHDFFAASEDDELKDIAFIDGDESTYIEDSDASTGAEIEGPTRLQKRTELRLNTKMSCMNQRFDFLSPTSFDHPEWNDFNHLETVNHCLLTQMEELEKERDSLKDLVYRDDAVINEMTQQIDRLQNSEQEFKERISKLEATEMQAGQHINRIEAHCDELRAKLKRAESMETSLRNDLEARCKSQAEIEAKLLKSVQSLEQTTVKLRSNLNEVEKEKSEAIKQSEELQAQILSLQSKEYKTLHKIKSLENLHDGLCEKTSDLESSLTLAYDEVAGLTRQKEGLTQRLNSITDENTDLRRENDELIVEKINLAKEVERLNESENFLKEANRKMWLSLQANIDEYGMCKKCKNFCSDVDEETTSSVDMISSKNPICKEISVQTEKIIWCRRNKSSHQGSIYGFQQGFTQFASDHTHILVAIANLITHLSSRSCKLRNLSQRQKLWSEGSLETEKKARIEEMLKFVNSSRYRSKSNENSDRNATTGKQNYEAEDADKPQQFGDDVSELDAVEGEEEFWNVVENYEDIYDVRAADTWNLWRHLELDLMRLNLDDLRKLLESREADKSCQTSLCDFPSSVQQSMQFLSSGSSKIKEFETELKAEVHTPPLPTTLPPDDENLLMNDIISCSEQSTQTETIEKSVASNVKDRDDSTTLLHLLNQNERALSAQKNEVDRLTIEMRSWQQKALEAADQVSRLTTELSTAQQLIESTKDRSAPRTGSTSSIIDNNSQHLMTIENRRSRIELPSSQIPVSVKRAVDFYSSISQSSGSTSPGPIHSKTSLIPRLVPEAVKSEQGAHPTTSTKITTQGPLSNGSSSSQQQQQDVQPSHIPRLLPEWIQQQQQQLIQQREDGSNSESCDGNMATGSSLNLQQLPAAEAATAASAAGSSDVQVTAEMEAEVPQHPGVESVDMPDEEF